MITREKIISDIQQLPEEYLEELYNVIRNMEADKGNVVRNNQNKRPILESIRNIMKNIPDEDIKKLPVDSSEQHDHYLYNTPKHQEGFTILLRD